MKGHEGEDLQDPLTTLHGRHLIERFVDVRRNISVHTKLQNLGTRMKLRDGGVNMNKNGDSKSNKHTTYTLSSLSFQMPYA